MSLEPIYIYFDIDEQNYLKYHSQTHASANQSQVRIALPGETELSMTGCMDFIENRLDPSTGTLRLDYRDC